MQADGTEVDHFCATATSYKIMLFVCSLSLAQSLAWLSKFKHFSQLAQVSAPPCFFSGFFFFPLFFPNQSSCASVGHFLLQVRISICCSSS